MKVVFLFKVCIDLTEMFGKDFTTGNTYRKLLLEDSHNRKIA